MLVLLVSLSLPHSLEHSLGLVHLVLLLFQPRFHCSEGILRIGSVQEPRRASLEQLMGRLATC